MTWQEEYIVDTSWCDRKRSDPEASHAPGQWSLAITQSVKTFFSGVPLSGRLASLGVVKLSCRRPLNPSNILALWYWRVAGGAWIGPPWFQETQVCRKVYPSPGNNSHPHASHSCTQEFRSSSKATTVKWSVITYFSPLYVTVLPLLDCRLEEI